MKEKKHVHSLFLWNIKYKLCAFNFIKMQQTTILLTILNGTLIRQTILSIEPFIDDWIHFLCVLFVLWYSYFYIRFKLHSKRAPFPFKSILEVYYTNKSQVN